jgi:2',3'-cyclic-nucleotide 2'-phosphodiesterase (5'-nucleotidase family)
MLAAVPEADIAMMNAGALRADLPAGEVRRSQLFTVFPFDNRLATVELTGEQVREILDVYHARSRGLMQVAGLRLDVSCSPPFDVRALAMEDGRPIAPDELYTVVISDFLLSGGDGLGKVLDQVPQERKHVHGEGLIRDVVRRYLLRAAAGKAGLDELLRPAEVRFIGQGACRASGRPTRRPICR